MKLDYLQFLELEVFTRFGARLEASAEARIKRGRVLREILKQDRLALVPAEFQMAWLAAYSEHLLDDTPLAEIPGALARLEAGVRNGGPAIEDSHDAWLRAAKGWLGRE